MSSSRRVAVIFLLVFLYPIPSAMSFEGPFQVKNLYPVFLHADQPYLEKAAVENSMSYSLSHSSTYTVQESEDWVIHLDMEITEMNFRYKRIIQESVEFAIDIPVLMISGGFLDGFLEDYHDAVGFGDYGRSQRPNNEFLYEVRKDGEVLIEGKSGIRLGDIRVALKAPLIASDAFNVSIKGDIEIPVSSAKQGFSNGSLDAGASILMDIPVTEKIRTYGNFGVVFPGDVRGHEKINLKNYLYGGAAIEVDAGGGLYLITQLQGQSSVYPDTDLQAVDRDAYMIVFGGRYRKEGKSIELSLTEDLSTSGAPDFIVNVTFKRII
ncbi:MAG: hypothetical protein AMK71_06440 [Nitrospira bacterium SG8_35_4]|nr:MAG: hypothetical protein AMK71_06440 [Nitrospira bacterium SG8_35_4]